MIVRECPCGANRFAIGLRVHGVHVTQRVVKCVVCGAEQAGVIIDWRELAAKGRD